MLLQPTVNNLTAKNSFYGEAACANASATLVLKTVVSAKQKSVNEFSPVDAINWICYIASKRRTVGQVRIIKNWKAEERKSLSILCNSLSVSLEYLFITPFVSSIFQSDGQLTILLTTVALCIPTKNISSTVEPSYNDIRLHETSTTASDILSYQLIPHC